MTRFLMRPLVSLTSHLTSYSATEERIAPLPGDTGTGEIHALTAAFNRLTARLHEREDALIETMKRYRLITENSTDLITKHTPTGAILYASPVAATVLGMPHTALIGRSMLELVHPDDYDTVRACFQRGSSRKGAEDGRLSRAARRPALRVAGNDAEADDQSRGRGHIRNPVHLPEHRGSQADGRSPLRSRADRPSDRAAEPVPAGRAFLGRARAGATRRLAPRDAADRHRPVQEHQRHARARHGRLAAEARGVQAQVVHPRLRHAGALGRRRVRAAAAGAAGRRHGHCDRAIAA